MENKPKESSLENLESDLYSREDREGVQGIKRHGIPKDSIVSKDGWDHSDEHSEVRTRPRVSTTPIMVFFASLLFLIIAMGWAFFNFYSGTNTVSGNNVDIKVTGPVSISGGDIVSIDIEVGNRNSIPLQIVDLHVQYPEGTREVDNIATPLRRFDQILGDMPSGASVKRSVTAVLFGGENERKTVRISVEYRVQGSNAIFSKEKNYDIVISSSPVNVSVLGPTEVNSSQMSDFLVTVTSNSPLPIKGLLLRAEYPFGFDFDSSVPAPSGTNNVWVLGGLDPGATKTVRVRGSISGQDGEEKVLHFSVGIPSETDEHVVATPFVTTDTSVLIQRAFMNVGLSLNGVSSDDVVAKTGAVIRADLSWQNNLQTSISDMEIQVALAGSALDRGSVTVSNGFYRSSDNTIVFNKRTTPELSLIEAGRSGKTSFTIAVLPPSAFPNTSLSNADISLIVTTNAKSSDTESSRDLSTVVNRRVKIASDFRLTARGIYFSGPFKNTGPIPPRVEQDTTYTIKWSVDNNLNLIRRGVVTATIPSYVSWLGVVSPDSERMSYDVGTGRITWDLGDVRSGVGTALPRREVSFQVSLKPSLSQVGSSPALVNNIQMTGTDSFTNTQVLDSGGSININITTDPQFDISKGKVIQ